MQIKEFQSEENAGRESTNFSQRKCRSFPVLIFKKLIKEKKCKGKFYSNQI